MRKVLVLSCHFLKVSPCLSETIRRLTEETPDYGKLPSLPPSRTGAVWLERSETNRNSGEYFDTVLEGLSGLTRDTAIS